eukprot:TRINITY_DN7270_c0_g1_i1.p1 TRINITY_DN7270_c0_g1~~TRINITY_DN7270_c0_g1_i1.p1  ORF type:complete len:543 (-),score=116.01 TRINITY_DN7270_c0_g1_i1:122-1717(-)
MGLRDDINKALRGAEPLKVIVGTAGAMCGLYIAGKLVTTDFDEIKQTLGYYAFQTVKFVPGAQGKIDGELKKAMEKMEEALGLADDKEKNYTLPEQGIESSALLEKMKVLQNAGDVDWSNGKVSGTVYVGDDAHVDLVNKAYCMFSLTNPLHPDVFPAVRKFEAEVISMTARMLGGNESTCGAVTSGGTESLLMACKAYRNRARELYPHIKKPEIVLPITAHAAFDKAEDYFGLKLVHVPCPESNGGRADVAAMRAAITPNTILLVGSSPSYSHGIIDPISEIAALALEHNLPCHVDACLGGFVIPWMKRIGYPIPDFDFSVPGVTSMSADTHKYGYAPKGTSVIMFADTEVRKYMYFVATDWPGGIYCSPSVAGSRPGGLVAACWASLMSMGEEGYLKTSDQIAQTAYAIRDSVKQMTDVHVMGEPVCMVVGIGSSTLDIFKVGDAMSKRGWNLNTLQKPNSIHICVTPRHVGHEDEFIRDLKEAIEHVKTRPDDFKGGMAGIYGLAVSFPDRSVIDGLVRGYLDTLLKV